MNQPFNLIEAAVAFLDDRYRRGFVRVSSDNRVSAFARYAADRGHTWPMTVELCLGWARDGAEIADPYTWARRLDSLRPTAMHLLQSGVDISVIALWLGHESPATTFIYLSADMKMKEEALLRLQPTVIGTKRFKASDDLLAFLKGL